MNYEVVLTLEADRNARSIIAWYTERSQAAADRWYNEFSAAIASLGRSPEQYAVARENSRFPIELRQLNFGGGRRITHRILYTIRPGAVVIAQQDWRPDDDPAA
jgi:plasmid stabilization system protein ParE